MEAHLSPVNGDCEAVERSCQFEKIGCSARQVCIKYLVFIFSERETLNFYKRRFRSDLALNF